MKYYNITNSTGKETGRTYPQLHCLTQPYAHSMNAWQFPSFTPKLIFELEKTAQLTDVLSSAAVSSGNGFLVNSKVKDIFSDFNLMTHKYYDANIVVPKTGETLNYYWLHLCQPELSMQLDYKKSVFYETEWTFRKDIINIASYKHYEELKAKDKRAIFGVDLDEIFVTEKFNKDLDIFTFIPFTGQKFISSKLKDALENNKVTGLAYEETTEIKF